LAKTVPAIGLGSTVAGDVAVLTLVVAAGVHVDAIAMARSELQLIGERTVPLHDARPRNLQHFLLRAARQKVERHRRPIGLAQFLENRAVFRMNPLRVRDAEHNWRIMYRIYAEAVVILDVYPKKTRKIPDEVIRRCKDRLKLYDATMKDFKSKG
jgi:phage-related protein